MPGPRRGLATSGLDTVIPQPTHPNGDIDPIHNTAPNGADRADGDTTAGPARTTSGPSTADTPPPAPDNSPVGERRKEKIAGYVSSELADHARNAVSALGNHVDDPQSLSELLESAIRREVTRLQDERNGGQPFPPRVRRSLPVGRRAE